MDPCICHIAICNLWLCYLQSLHHRLIRARGPAPGSNPNSLQAEAYGTHGVLQTIHRLLMYPIITVTRAITKYIDSKGVIVGDTSSVETLLDSSRISPTCWTKQFISMTNQKSSCGSELGKYWSYTKEVCSKREKGSSLEKLTFSQNQDCQSSDLIFYYYVCMQSLWSDSFP